MKEKETHLFDYFLVLRRRRWVVFSTFLLVLVVSVIGAYKKPDPLPLYQSSTTLVVKPERPALVNMSGGQPFYQQYFDEGVDQRTQLQILSSRVILEQVLGELGRLDSTLDVENDSETLIENLRRAIGIEQIPGTYLVRITARDHASDKAVQLANVMAEVYIEYNLQSKLSSARKTLVWLNEQIVDLRTKVQDAYGALSTYQNQNQILLSLEMSADVQAQKLSELNNVYEQARQQRVEADARMTELKKWRQQQNDRQIDMAISLHDPVLEKLRMDLMNAEIERASVLQSYKEKHPKFIEADLKVQTLRQSLEKTLDTLFQKFETDVSVARAKEQAAAESLARFKREAMELNEKRLEYSKLKSEVSSTEELYNLLFQQLKETTITSDLERNNIQILEPARTAQNITQPIRREQVIGLGVIIGIVLGIGLAFLFEYFDKTVKNPEDVEFYIGLAVLGTIPKIDKNYGKSYGRSSSLSGKKHYAALEGDN